MAKPSYFTPLENKYRFAALIFLKGVKLCHIKLVINAFLRQQLCRIPFLNDSALIHHEDAVCLLDRGQSVCNDKRCPACQQMLDTILYQ